MRDLYIGGQRPRKSGGFMWKLYLFLFLFFIALGGALKVSAPVMVERWLNEKGSGDHGFAYSVREVELALREGEIILKDLKVYHPQSKVEIAKTTSLKVEMDLPNMLSSGPKRVEVSAASLDVFLSDELASEIDRMKTTEMPETLYFSLLKGNFSQVNIIEKKEDISRILLKLQEVAIDMKELSLSAVNKNSEFSFNSKLISGGEFSFSGKVNAEEQDEKEFWQLEGALKEFSPELLNRLAGAELPFTYNESTLSAQIMARSKEGKIEGEILPQVSRLNLVIEGARGQKQTIARALTEELIFNLPFQVKSDFTLEYEDTFKKLKDYRKYPLSVASSGR